MAENICVLCNELLIDDVVEVTRGLDTLRNFCKENNPAAFTALVGLSSATVHRACRKRETRRFTTPPSRTSTQESDASSSRVLQHRSAHRNFDFQTRCVLCSVAIPASTGLAKYKVSEISKDYTKDHLLRICDKRKDDWGDTVRTRILTVTSLVGEGAKYHRKCYSDFLSVDKKFVLRSPSPSPTASTAIAPHLFPSPPAGTTPVLSKVKRGRRVDPKKSQAFIKLCEFLESAEECQFTSSFLMQKMGSSATSGCYGERHLARLLQAKYGDDIVVTARPGKSSLLCFAGAVGDILNEAWYASRSANKAKERQKIIKTAAALILKDIKKQAFECDTYPGPDEIAEGGWSLIPQSLRLFLTELVIKSRKVNVDKYKRVCDVIGQALISAVRPRSFIPPSLLGLAVFLHRNFESRELIDVQHSLGLSVSYPEVQRYEKQILQHAQPAIDDPEAYIQFVFDNVDLNVQTIDGLNTLHIMGGIEIITPGEAVSFASAVPRRPTDGFNIASFGSISLEIYSPPSVSGLRSAQVMDLRPTTPCDGIISHCDQIIKHVDNATYLWLAGSTYLQGTGHHAPGWAGFMESATEGSEEYSTSAIVPTRFVNLSPSNPSTVYTCLIFAAEQAKARGQSKVVVTFDQPLCQKAMEIVLSEPPESILKNVVVRLGGFHLLMSYMSAVGYLMAGSGIEELWASVYATNSVQHMMSGKAFARSLRAHFLTQTALFRLICDHDETGVLKIPSQRQHLTSLMQQAQTRKMEFYTVTGEHSLKSAVASFERTLKTLSLKRMGKLWCLYFRLVHIMRLYVTAERTGNWNLHLYCVREMLPVFRATGRLNYSKTAQLYLQEMIQLEETLPALEFDKFSRKGFFAIRRSKKFWSGLWTDLTIEQCLMRSFHSRGGLSRGRGVTESTKALWVGTMPFCSKILQALENFAGRRSQASDQHVEMRESRQIRNKQDTDKYFGWLQLYNPFEEPHTLRCLSTGKAADSNVNCDDALEIGCKYLEQMIGKNFHELTIPRKERALNIASVSNTVRVEDECMLVSTQTLIHRINCVIDNDTELEECLSYELSALPSSLFDQKGMRKGTKSSLFKVLEEFSPSNFEVPSNALYVLDGGYLLHRVVWPRPCTYQDVITAYARFVTRKYTSEATVVFDGYTNSMSTKDSEHQRRSARTTSVDILFDLNMTVTVTQSRFLSNAHNKTRLINFLGEALRKCGVNVLQAPGDADRLIALAAIDLSLSKSIDAVVVAQDIDVLVLVTNLGENASVYFLAPGSSKNADKCFKIPALRAALGDLADILLFFHCETGCDTSGAPQGKGKKQPLLKFKESHELRETSKVFYKTSSSNDEIASAGEKCLLAIYGMSAYPTLNAARYPAYLKAVSRRPVHGEIDMSSLPPTSAAALQHHLRVYHQVQSWIGRDLPATSYGWKVDERNKLAPVTTLQPPAPEKILKLTACKCKGDCSTRSCGCRKSGLRCSAMCANCNGINCTNGVLEGPRPVLELEETEEEVDDPSFPI